MNGQTNGAPDENALMAMGTSWWQSGLALGDTVWEGIGDVAASTGGFISDQYNAFTGTVEEVVTTPGDAIKDVAAGYAEALQSIAAGIGDAARATGEGFGDAIEDTGDAVKYAPIVAGVIGIGLFVAYRKGLL